MDYDVYTLILYTQSNFEWDWKLLIDEKDVMHAQRVL